MSSTGRASCPARFRIPASKSELIRALLLHSFEESIVIEGDSRCEDVRNVRRAIGQLSTRVLDLGDSGLGFRCLALRASRLATGPVLLSGSSRLLSRPHAELWSMLGQLGCRVSVGPRGAEIVPPPDGQWSSSRVQVRGGESSQFASAVLLSSMGLEQDFTLVVEEPLRSRGYLQLTVKFLASAGVVVSERKTAGAWEITVPAKSRPAPGSRLRCEGDWSTAAGLAAVAAVHGPAGSVVEMEGLSSDSMQPDRVVLDWLTQMGVESSWSEGVLSVRRARSRLRGITVSAEKSPDLVPVFAALASLAEGRSEFHSAPQLRHKESDRIALAVRLAWLLGADAGEREEGFWIEPRENMLPVKGVWSSDRDHRQVMAAYVALAAGARFSIDDITVVAKSAPEFLEWMDQLSLRPRAPALLFIGHRGTGKTSLARRLSERVRRQGRALEVVDLDAEIEARAGKTLSEIFSRQGEEAFRVIEREVLRDWIERPVPASGRILVAGAGMDPQLESSEWQGLLSKQEYDCIWISRSTDAQGRIFLDRPRLDSARAPLEEFVERAQVREPRYRLWSTRRAILNEGSDRHAEASEGECSLLLGVPNVSGATITIPRELLSSPERLQEWLHVRRGWPWRYFEIREDLLPASLTGGQATRLLRSLEILPGRRILFSRRMAEHSEARTMLQSVLRNRGAALDWALEIGPVAVALQAGDVVSSHGPGVPDLEVPAGCTLKWSPSVAGWEALEAGHHWWMAGLPSRVFLPRSSNGRWRCYRLWAARKWGPKFHFLREDEGSAPDQPTILEWLQNPDPVEGFGAVLGKPVFHSRSPERHQPNFHAFEIAKEEWDAAVPFLRSLGLDRAAVTSPLKEVAFAWAVRRGAMLSDRARRLESVNTLDWRNRPEGSPFRADNTDLPGFESVLKAHQVTDAVPAVLWGGGGTAAMVRELLPSVSEFSARTGDPRDGRWPSAQPEVLIWGVGRSVFTGVFPPSEWRPRWIIDLNYAEDSPGLEYAQRLGAATKYVSGHGLFEAQASLQFRDPENGS